MNEFIVSRSSQPCRRNRKRSTVGHQTCGALPSCCGSWWPERFHLPTCLIWKLAWRLADPPFWLNQLITFKACWNCFSIAPYLVLPACSFRLPWRAWGPPSHLEYRHIFASLWRYAWTKTRRRGLNLIWLCQFWKKCRTNKRNKSFRALLFWTRYDKWWCGAYQYCLKILLCCCIQGHCSFSFWEKFSSSHIFYIYIFF